MKGEQPMSAGFGKEHNPTGVAIDHPESARRSPRRGRPGKILGVIMAILLLLAIGIGGGCYFWWQGYKSSPGYSLALIVDAAQRNDTATFGQLVDIDKIVDNFIPQIENKAAAQLPGVVDDLLGKQIDSLLPKVLPKVKQAVRDEIAGEIKQLAKKNQGKPFPLIVLAIAYTVKTQQQGDSATLDVTFKDPLQLTMQRIGDRWKVIAVKDDALAARIVNDAASQVIPNLLGGR
jgi:hypothetical protein